MLKKTTVMNIKVFYLLLFSLGLSLSLQAQFGVNGKYLFPGDNWQVTGLPGQEETGDLFNKGWSAGLDFWFRLKNKRVEFLPELNYAQLSSPVEALPNSEARIYSFFFNTNFYFWDFTGDCDCPTFSKQGPTLEKGLFIQISPGISYWDVIHGNELIQLKDQAFAFSIGGGVGFDLGITDLITLTPMANVRYFPKVDLEGIAVSVNDINFNLLSRGSASPLIWSAGLRLGFRLDYRSY